LKLNLICDIIILAQFVFQSPTVTTRNL